MAGANFGCGSSHEHPAVGLAHAGVKAVICKSVNRIFCCSSDDQELPIIILPEAVDACKQSDNVSVELGAGTVNVGCKDFKLLPLSKKIMNIFNSKGLVNYIKTYA